MEHDCPSQMNYHLMLSNSTLKSDELIWLSSSSIFSSFVGYNHALMGVYYIVAMLTDRKLIDKFK